MPVPPPPHLVIAVQPPLLAEALARVLAAHRPGASGEAASRVVDVVPLARERDVDGVYLLRLPGSTAEPALLVSPRGSTPLVLDGLSDVIDLVDECLRRD
jgi:hypothetical protein